MSSQETKITSGELESTTSGDKLGCTGIHVNDLDMSAVYLMMIFNEVELEKLCADQLKENETFLVLNEEDQKHENDTVEFNILDTRYVLPREDLKDKSIAKLGMTDDFKRRFSEYKSSNQCSITLTAVPIPLSYLKDAEWELKIFFRSRGWLICPNREGVLIDDSNLKEIYSFYGRLSKKYMRASNDAEIRVSKLIDDVGHLEDMLDSKEELVYNLLADKQELLESKNETIQVLKEVKIKLAKEVKKRDSKIVRLKADLAAKELEFREENFLDDNHVNQQSKEKRKDHESEELNENLKYLGDLIINGEVHLACMYCHMRFGNEDELYEHEGIC